MKAKCCGRGDVHFIKRDVWADAWMFRRPRETKSRHRGGAAYKTQREEK